MLPNQWHTYPELQSECSPTTPREQGSKLASLAHVEDLPKYMSSSGARKGTPQWNTPGPDPCPRSMTQEQTARLPGGICTSERGGRRRAPTTDGRSAPQASTGWPILRFNKKHGWKGFKVCSASRIPRWHLAFISCPSR